MSVDRRIQLAQLTAVGSVVFALIGFSYNAWRMEVTEDNNNVRTAGFEILLQLAELEQIVYAAHYDHDSERGNPRDGWVRVGLITDLSHLTAPSVAKEADSLRASWQENWPHIRNDRAAADAVIDAIDQVRNALTSTLKSLH